MNMKNFKFVVFSIIYATYITGEDNSAEQMYNEPRLLYWGNHGPSMKYSAKYIVFVVASM